MITAKEAKQLYDESDAKIEQFLKNSVEKRVADAAKSGNRFIFIFLGTLGPYEYIDQKPTPLDKAVVKKLQELGYHANFDINGPRYVPRGLADDEGNGPSHQNYGIKIAWA
jgi:hypothetical protein